MASTWWRSPFKQVLFERLDLETLIYNADRNSGRRSGSVSVYPHSIFSSKACVVRNPLEPTASSGFR